MDEQTCKWTLNTLWGSWDTECNKTWASDIDIDDFEFCPSCGKPIIIEGEDDEI